MLKSGKGRITLAVVLLALLGVGGFAYVSSSSDVEEVDEAVVAIETADKTIKTIPGTSKDAEYNKLQEEANIENYQKAKEEGGSYVPTLTRNDLIEEEIKPVEKEEVVVEEPFVVVEEPKPEPIVSEYKPPAIKEVVKYVPVVQAPPAEPAIDANLYALYRTEMETIKQGYSQTSGEQSFHHAFAGIKQQLPNENVRGYEGNAYNSQSSNVGSATQTQTNKGAAFVRAGTILPGMMLTAVNTDEPGPVIAEIVSGPLKGARLIGQVVNAPTDVTARIQKATIQFSRLEQKGAKQGFSINVFAVDPETMNTGVASDVNNHTFLRYGGGLAAAFLEGLGNAFADSNKSVTYTDQATITSSVSTKTKDHMKSALGNVGVKLGSELSKITDVPATIYVDSGHPIGLLFMSDF